MRLFKFIRGSGIGVITTLFTITVHANLNPFPTPNTTSAANNSLISLINQKQQQAKKAFTEVNYKRFSSNSDSFFASEGTDSDGTQIRLKIVGGNSS